MSVYTWYSFIVLPARLPTTTYVSIDCHYANTTMDTLINLILVYKPKLGLSQLSLLTKEMIIKNGVNKNKYISFKISIK